MSKVIKWQETDFFQPSKEKAASIIISEIIFLKHKLKANGDQVFLQMALEKLEYLLNAIKSKEFDLTEKDFNSTILIIYNIFRDITESIDFV